MTRTLTCSGRDARHWLGTFAAVAVLFLAGTAAAQQNKVKAAQPPGPPQLKRPFSPVVEEIWRALNTDDIRQELQKEGMDLGDLNRLRQEFDRVNDSMKKSWDGYRRVVGFYPNYARVAQPPTPAAGRLGATVAAPTPALVDQLGLPKGQGLVVRDVDANSAAAKAGLKTNDILMKLDGKAVPADPTAFRQQVAGLRGNQPLEVQVLRKGKTETLRGLTLPAVK